MMRGMPIQLFVLTGFLGSGKSTLLQRVLANAEFADTALVINELGSIAIDHDLIGFHQESVFVAPGGCICCTVREDIQKAIRILVDKVAQGSIRPFRRLIIETTGLADPMPLLATLERYPLARERFTRPLIVTLVDGQLGSETLGTFSEARSQVALAHQIVISKADVMDAINLHALERRIRSLNRGAPCRGANLRMDSLEHVFAGGEALQDARSFAAQVDAEVFAAPEDTVHTDRIQSVSLVLDERLSWNGFSVWLTAMLHCYGDRILRFKAILATEESDRPLVLQAAQHVVYEPYHLMAWPSEDRRSRFVFILKDLDPCRVKQSLLAVQAMAKGEPGQPLGLKLIGAGSVIGGRPVRRASTPAWMKG
jgi:G3E family GTPase